MSSMTDDLLPLDEQAFGARVEPHRRELHVHCYRLLGSFEEAEDLVQEAFLRAWRRRETYEGRASVRARPQEAGGGLLRLWHADCPGRLRRAHDLLLPDVPDSREDPQGPAVVAPAALERICMAASR
jgi:hypothetical protein